MSPASPGPACRGSGSTSTGRNPASPAYWSRYRATGESKTATRVRVTVGAGAAPCATSQAGSSGSEAGPAGGGGEGPSGLVARVPRGGGPGDSPPREPKTELVPGTDD